MDAFKAAVYNFTDATYNLMSHGQDCHVTCTMWYKIVHANPLNKNNIDSFKLIRITSILLVVRITNRMNKHMITSLW